MKTIMIIQKDVITSEGNDGVFSYNHLKVEGFKISVMPVLATILASKLGNMVVESPYRPADGIPGSRSALNLA
ncbi:hypothetical protein [Levilactobacillus enshiensis]|uniref:hypothetical protein n=1 Tax=Levilactobacillus enshiensis TaxID=2590213 RepID=UPI00117AB80A|nr:hypothetical protein [Levilactobacillus enshiensis]